MKLFRNYEKPEYGFIAIFIITLIFIITFSIINLLKYRIFSPTTFGWATIYNYSKIVNQHRFLRLSIFPETIVTFTLKPLNYLLAFFYSFIPHPEILFIAQVVIIGIGAIIVYLLSKQIIKSTILAISFSVAYLLHPVIVTGAMLGFIYSILGSLFLFCTFYYVEKQDFKKSILFVILGNVCDIWVSIMLIIYSLILILYSNNKTFGKIILKISVFVLIIITGFTLVYLKLINRLFPVQVLHLESYGDTMADVWRFVFSYPGIILKNILNEHNFIISIFLIVPNLFAFFCPIYLLPAVPLIGYILIRNQHASAQFLILSFVFLAALYGMRKILIYLDGFLIKYCGVKWKNIIINTLIPYFIIISVFIRHYYIKPKSDFGETLGPIPFSSEFKFDFYKITPHVELGYRFLKLIPSTASCLTSPSLANHLGTCRELGVFNRFFVKSEYPWDYIFVDLSKGDFYRLSPKDFFLALIDFLTCGTYGVYAYDDGWLLLKKN